MENFKFIKLKPNTKIPISLTYTQEERIKDKWISEGYNIGILLENLVLIDIDSYKKETNLDEEISAIKEILGDPILVQRTFRNGSHLIFENKHNAKFDSRKFRNQLKKIGIKNDHIDIKSHPNSFFVSAPSTIDNQKYIIVESKKIQLKNNIEEFLIAEQDLPLFMDEPIVFQNGYYKTNKYKIQKPLKNGLNKKSKKRHIKIWHHACIIADKLSNEYNIEPDLISFGAKILQNEIQTDEYVKTKFTNHGDHGWNYCFRTIEKAIKREKSQKRNPNHYKAWKQARSTLINSGWNYQELAALDTILHRAKSFNSTIFWMSAREFKSNCPIADHNLIQKMIDKDVIEILEKGNFWTGMATTYRLKKCNHKKGKIIPFNFDSPHWSSNNLSEAFTLWLLHTGKTIEETATILNKSVSTIYRHIQSLTQQGILYKTTTKYTLTKESLDLLNRKNNVLIARKRRYKLERKNFEDFREEIKCKLISQVVNLTHLKAPLKKNPNVYRYNTSNYLNSHSKMLREALYRTNSIRVFEYRTYVNYNKLLLNFI